MKKLADIFKDLEDKKWSGRIILTATDAHAYFYFSFGNLLFSHRPIDRANERISKISWINAVDEQIATHLTNWEEYVQLLLKANKENQEQVLNYLKKERLELFYRAFFWRNIEITPESSEMRMEDFPGLQFFTPVPIEKLLKEVNQRTLEWPKIQERVGSSKRIFVSRLDFGDSRSKKGGHDEIDRALANFETTGGRMLGFDLGPFSEEELALIRACDGSRTVADLIRESEDGEYLSLQRLLKLWDKGIIFPKDADTSSQTSPPIATNLNKAREFQFVFFCFAVFAVFAGSAIGLRFLSPISLTEKPKVSQSIEIYRGVYGRYPVSLKELQAGNLLQGPNLTEFFNYQLINLKEYSLDVNIGTDGKRTDSSSPR